MSENYKPELYEGDEFADEQVVDNLIKEFQTQKTILKKVLKTQNNLIDKLKIFEEEITDSFIELRKGIIKNKEDKERTDFAQEFFVKLIKVEKNTKINNANVHLLEMRLENIDTIIQNEIYNKNK